MMFLPDGKSCWMFVVEIIVLLYGIFIKNSICENSGTNEICRLKNVLFLSTKRPDSTFTFPSEVVYREVSGSKLCFDVQGNNAHADCCSKEEFNCNIEIRSNQSNIYSLILDKEALSKQDILLMRVPDYDFHCMPSELYNTNSGFLLNIHNCLKIGVKNIRLSQNDICNKSANYDEEACKGLAETKYKITVGPNKKIHCVSCEPPRNVYTDAPPTESNNISSSLENALNVMKNLSSMLETMGSSTTADIKIGDIKGVITKLSRTNPATINIGITRSRDVILLRKDTDPVTGYSAGVHIPKEASDMAIQRNGSFAGVLLFPGIHQDDPSSSFLNDEMVGIEMGTEISNLSHTIDIHFTNVSKNGNIASCRSWDGKGNKTIWITDGCRTNETGDSITCQCSHLTFFAILMSPPPQNMSAADFKSLSYITSIGCGLSMFFLTVALFMHCLIRKTKASQATVILINLFVAMFSLNLSFLVNESIADLVIFGACVAIATVMHYTMLATFTWFFIEALHLYFNLWKLPTEIKHYMTKICVTGWVTPAVVVIALLALGKYDYMVVYTDDGNSAKMCWISDAVVHQGVNISYYGIVFIFTFTIFIITVRQIALLKPTAGKGQDISSIKKNSISIVCLLFLLGITWAFAFFSYGPMRTPSYYIFTILNSFQGFFLFIYYYNSRKSCTTVSSSTATSNTAVTSPYP